MARPLPEGVLEDDGVDRGFMFAFVGAHIDRQFEFVQSQWMNSGEFAGRGNAKDPIAGASDGTETFTIPDRPIRQLPARVCRASWSRAEVNMLSCPVSASLEVAGGT